MTRLNEMKLGDTFLMDGLTQNGRTVKVKATLIDNEGNNYIVLSEGNRILLDGYEVVSKLKQLLKKLEVTKIIRIFKYKIIN